MGLISAFVATYANTKTSAPIYICAVLYIAMVSEALEFSHRGPQGGSRCYYMLSRLMFVRCGFLGYRRHPHAL